MKHIGIEHFCAIGSDEALCETILPWLARLDVCQADVAGLSPALNGEGDKLTAIV